MNTRTALEAVTGLRAALAEAGLPRTSTCNGGEMTGWTEAYGSTGFSIRACADGSLVWHVVVSGRPLLRYRTYESRGDELYEPIEPERLYPRIRSVFEAQGLDVRSVDCTGHQTMWDDDVSYEIATGHPDWLEAKPAVVRRVSGWF